MRRLHDLHLPSTGVDKWLLRCLAFHVLLVGVSQGRVVVRGLAVLSAEGLSISGEHQQTSAIPSSDGGGGGGAATLGLGRRPSIVLDCVYDLVPSANIHNNGSRGAPLTAIDGVGGKYNDSHTNNNTDNNNLSSSNDNEGRSSNNNNKSKSSSSNNNNSSNNNIISNSTNNNKDGASAILAGLSVDRRRRENERTPRVVKWFRNSEATPFYQWIPSSHSRLFHHAYRDLLDTLYKHSDRPADMFRAVRITRLVRELSGNFTCEVQDEELDDEVEGDANDSGIAEDASEQMATHELRIYDPPVEFEIHLNLAAEQLYCTAWTSEPPESIHMRLFRHDHDAWQMPLGPPVDLNATTTVRDLRTRTAVPMPSSSPSSLWPGPLSLSPPPPSSSSSSSWSPTNAVSDALLEIPSVATTTVRGRPSSEEATRQKPAPPPQPPPSSSAASSSSPPPPPPPPTNRPTKANHKYQLVRVEASARLHAEDVKHLDVDTSRTFVCELIYERLRQQHERSVLANDNATVSPYPAADNDGNQQSTAVIRETAPVFQRSVKIVHESPSSAAAAEGAADYGDRWDDEIGAPKPAETKGPPFWSAWITAVSRDVSVSPSSSSSSSSSASASTSSARTGRSVSLRQATCTQEASLYERAYYRLAPAVGLPLLGLLYTYTL